MSREVDVKALISHLVRGDGGDKCRICMGDTSEGQVYLGDTVIMDGERPVTLAELLEVITGVEVAVDAELPNSLCSTCSDSTIDAANFTQLCRKANTHWNTTLKLLNGLPKPYSLPDKCKSVYAVLEGDRLTLIHDNDSDQSSDEKTANDLRIQVKRKTSRKRYAKLICSCPMCNKTFQRAHHLHNHLKESSDYQRACHFCAKVMSRDELVSHLGSEHNAAPLDCKKCPAMFHSRTSLKKKHLEEAHADGSCTCGDCGRSFRSQFGFRAHMSAHAPNTCPSCNQLFRNKRCYLHHLRTCCKLDKEKKKKLKTNHQATVEIKNKSSLKKVKIGLRGRAEFECICDYCNKKFSSKKLITAHILHVHTKKSHRPCPYCGKFLASAHMTEHLKKHELTRSYKCEYCNLVLKTRLGFIQHLCLHTGEKPFPCKQCGESFSASSRRSEHIRKVHKGGIPLRHACEMCPARFSLPFKLRKHMAAVHSVDGEKVMFECKECHEKFGSLRGLIHHGRKHQKGVVQQPRKKRIKLDPEAESIK